MQDTSSIIMLALVNNMPRVLPLREMVYHYIEHRVEIIERRTRFDLEAAEARAHILEGLKIAIDKIDEVIKIIRAAKDTEDAQQKLIKRFKLSVVQANAILAMRLRRLTGLERDELDNEYKELLQVIERLRNILSGRKTLLAEVRKGIEEVKDKYGDARRTLIVAEAGEFNVEDLIVEECRAKSRA